MDRFLSLFDGLSPGALYGLLGLVSFIEAIFPPAPADLLVAVGAFLAARQDMNLALTIAVIVTGIAASILPFLITSQTSYVLVGASMAPLMLAFLVPIVGRIRAGQRGTWRAGPWTLGRLGIPVAIAAGLAVTLVGLIALMPHTSLYGTDPIPYLAVVGLTVPFDLMPLIVLVLTLASGGLLVRWAFRDGGFHTRNSWAVERDLHVRRTLRHAGTCVTCGAPLAAGTEVSFDPESKRIFCFACEFLD